MTSLKLLPGEAEIERRFASRVTGDAMAPRIPDASLVLMAAGVNGSHCGPIVCVSKGVDPMRQEQSFSIGQLRVLNSEGRWAEKSLQIVFLRNCPPIDLLDDAEYRIEAEFLSVLEPDKNSLVCTERTPMPFVAAPNLSEWRAMSRGTIVELAARFPAPPEIFRKHPDLISENPGLAKTVMTNYQAFLRWVNARSDIKKALAKAGRRNHIVRTLGQMICEQWIARGEYFRLWYQEEVAFLCRRAVN